MPNDVTVKIEGLADLKRALADVPNKIRKGALKRALRLAGNTVRDAARAGAPVLQTSARHRKPGTVVRRKPGTVKDNIVVRASKFASRAGDVGVFVSVKPLRGKAQIKQGRAGAKNPNDPYYWWWQEFGWVAGGRRVRGGRNTRALVRKRALESGKARRIPGKYFLTNAAKEKGQDAISVFMREAIPAINRLNAKGKP